MDYLQNWIVDKYQYESKYNIYIYIYNIYNMSDIYNIYAYMHILAEIFQNRPILAFCRNKNLRDIIGTKLIENGKVKRKFTSKIQGQCTPCLANNRTLWCKQVVHTTTFRSNQRSKKFHIYHNLNCKTKYVIYLLDCTKCKI